jgi:LysM repeat protein
LKVEDIKKWNNLTSNSISIGQQLIVEGISTNTSMEGQNIQKPVNDRKLHTVSQSQTLYSLSRMYGVTTDQLMAWNNLKSNALDIGQVLIVSNPVEQLESENALNSSMLPVAENNDKKEVMPETQAVTQPNESLVIGITASEINKNSDEEEDIIEEPVEKIVQKGLAEVIDNTAETKKYLALHREAPIGTIMQVRNEMNNQSVFVRIVGQIPPTGENSKVILKISKKAYDRLGAVDNRFPVEISYIP